MNPIPIETELGAMAKLLLISLLATREIVTADTRPELRALGRSLDPGIMLLLMVSALIVKL